MLYLLKKHLCDDIIYMLCSKFFKWVKNLSWTDDPDSVKERENNHLRFAVGEVMLLLSNG